MARKPKSPPPPRPPDQPDQRRRPRPIPFWQKALLAISVVLMLGGGVAWAYAAFTRVDEPAPAASTTPSESTGSSLTDSGVSGFLPGAPALPGTGGDAPRETGGRPAPDPEDDRPIDVYSPAVFRLGFSFFAGFAMAYAVRQFVKVTLLVAGVVLLGMFALQYAGLVDINWSAIEGKYDSIADFFRRETASFTRFVSGYLPSATAAAAGAVIGFRRK